MEECVGVEDLLAVCVFDGFTVVSNEIKGSVEEGEWFKVIFWTANHVVNELGHPGAVFDAIFAMNQDSNGMGAGMLVEDIEFDDMILAPPFLW